MEKILVTGVNGQVGHELIQALAPLGQVIALTREDLDLTQLRQIQAVLEQYQPTIIVNPAAYTAVDKAESDNETAYQVNQFAPQIMAEWAAKHDALLIHYSTDYVFDGTKESAYNESDLTNPQSVYGRSKYLGEQAIRQAQAKHFILRTSWVFGVHGNNFIKTILRLAKERSSLNIVNDQHGAPTSATLIAKMTYQLIDLYIKNNQIINYGTYHLSAAGQTTWYDYARFIVQTALENGTSLALTANEIHGIPSSSYPVPAKRPTNSRLNCDKLTGYVQVVLPPWQQDVAQVIAQLK
jgi:dTDP-4-dehydrorhamnose reductase